MHFRPQASGTGEIWTLPNDTILPKEEFSKENAFVSLQVNVRAAMLLPAEMAVLLQLQQMGCSRASCLPATHADFDKVSEKSLDGLVAADKDKRWPLVCFAPSTLDDAVAAPRVFSIALDSPDRMTKSPAAPQTDGRLLMSPTALVSQDGCTIVPEQKQKVLKIYFRLSD
ncbi:Ceramide Kinase [Manis pentadactyla]|nr:Ceramide Kinase [Manis pentadactyla]